jgi:predicted permease
MNKNDIKLRLRALFSRHRMEQDLGDELEFHREMQVRKNLAAGMSEAEARRKARIAFGAEARFEEECREARGVSFFETTWRDIRYAVRGFRRTPTFAATVIATIALGLGILTALFTVLDAFYLRPVAVRDPHSLYEIFWQDRAGNGHDFSWPDYRQFLAENPAFSEALAFHRVGARVDDRNLSGLLVDGGYFHMLGVNAALGRALLPDDASTPGSQPVVVLSDSTWRIQFGGDRNVIGRKILLRGHPFEVVGVTPAGFNGLAERPTDFWAPLTMSSVFEAGPDLFGTGRPRLLAIVGRLRPGVDLRQAHAGVTLWMQRLTAGNLAADRVGTVVFVSRATAKPFNPKNTVMFSLVMVAFAIVLLIGCTNVANMMLARSVSRQQEIGIRLALGATRGRLIRQLLTESVLLALVAAVAGFGLSQGILSLCIRVMYTTLPPGIAGVVNRIPALPLDIRIVAFGMIAALLAAISFGLAPALQATRTNVTQAARGDFSSNFRPVRLRNSLVGAQITICVVLLITAALLLRGITRVTVLDRSLSANNSIEITIQEPSRARVLDRLSMDRNIETLAAAANAPVDRKPSIPVMPAGGSGSQPVALATVANNVSPEYFSLFEIPILRGRNFTADEARSGSAVVIVAQSTADQLWPNEDAVGRSLRLVPDAHTDPALKRWQVVTVIGVARDEISRWLTGDGDKGIIYFPTTPQSAAAKLFLSVHGDAETVRRKLDADISAIDPNALDSIQRLQIREWVAEEAYSFRVLYWMSSAIGICALLLTLSGIYGVMSYVVGQRTKEIGIRMALGATTRAVTGLVLKQSMRLAMLGTAVGAVLALGMSKLLSSVLVMINTFDILAYASGMLLVLAACAAAAYLPSRQAAQVDPMIALRHD